jgi:hypothetical protein
MLVWQNQAIEKCAKYGAGPSLPKSFQTAGVSLDLFGGAWPINGLRHKPEGSASGWFFWSGAVWSSADDFFAPMHISHFINRESKIIQYLGLPPGWRFLFDEKIEDVWFDPELLKT